MFCVLSGWFLMRRNAFLFSHKTLYDFLTILDQVLSTEIFGRGKLWLPKIRICKQNWSRLNSGKALFSTSVPNDQFNNFHRLSNYIWLLLLKTLRYEKKLTWKINFIESENTQYYKSQLLLTELFLTFFILLRWIKSER